MEYLDYPSRYLYIAGGFAVGGTTHQVGDVKVEVQIPSIAPVHLPLAGGISESKVRRTSIDCSKVKFGDLPREKLRQLKATELVSISSGYTRAQSEPEVKGQPFVCQTASEIKSLKIVGGLSLKHGLVTMKSSQDPSKSPFPNITFGEAVLSGLKLGKSELKVTLDIDTFNRYSTLAALEEAYGKDPELSNRFVTKGNGLYKSASGYVSGSIVKSIEGLPKDAQLLDAYTIFWPPLGRIVLGEVFVSPNLRRVSLVRVMERCIEAGSGCVGGGSYP